MILYYALVYDILLYTGIVYCNKDMKGMYRRILNNSSCHYTQSRYYYVNGQLDMCKQCQTWLE